MEGNDDQRKHVTAFVGTEASLLARYATVAVDLDAFKLRISRCTLSTCRGMCCYDGVYVDANTAEVLRQISFERAADFNEMGLDLPEEVIVHEQWRDGAVSGEKTAIKPFPFRSLVARFPEHFNETACVFHLDDGRCGLQVLAEQDGKDPWFYKPLTCWLHPIDISPTGITIHDESSDPLRFPDYDGYVCRTFCGQSSECGLPAAKVLEPELNFLGRILNRDLVVETYSDPMNVADPELK